MLLGLQVQNATHSLLCLLPRLKAAHTSGFGKPEVSLAEAGGTDAPGFVTTLGQPS